MYRTLLDHPEFLQDNKVHKSHKGSTNVKNKAESAPSSSKHNAVAAESKHTAAVAGENKQNIDDIFIKIRNLYTTHEYIIIYQTLMLLEKNPENYEAYVQGLNLIFSPKAEQIQKWINDNIVY